MEDLVDACNEALYEFSGTQDGIKRRQVFEDIKYMESACLLYTSDAADERSSVDLGGRRIIKKQKKENIDRRIGICI